MEVIIGALLAILILLGAVALGVLGMIVRGYVLSWLWLWFIVPLGVIALTIPHAIGISVITTLLTHQYIKDNTNDEKPSLTDSLIRMLGAPFVTLLVGYIVHSYM